MFCNNFGNNTSPQWKLLLTVTEAKQTGKYLEDFTCFAKRVLEEITDFIGELFDKKQDVKNLKRLYLITFRKSE